MLFRSVPCHGRLRAVRPLLHVWRLRGGWHGGVVFGHLARPVLSLSVSLRAFYTVAAIATGSTLYGPLGCREASPAPDRPRETTPLLDASPPTRDVPSPAEPSGVKVASFNVRRLFDTQCDTGECGSGAYEEAPSPARFSEKVATLAAGITRLRADIVLLQEVETQGCLDALKAKLPTLPHGFLAETRLPASVDVGILSAYPITETRSHGDFAIPLPNGELTSFARDFLEARVSTPDGELIVFVAHFRSKVNDDPDRRLAEARAAKRIVAEAASRNPSALVLLGGDLNDVPGSDELN